MNATPQISPSPMSYRPVRRRRDDEEPDDLDEADRRIERALALLSPPSRHTASPHTERTQ